MADQPFQPSDEVCLLDDPRRCGRVLSLDFDDQFDEVRVRLGDRAKVFGPDELERVESGPRDPGADVARGVLAPAHVLSTLLTYERVRRPPGPVGSSFGTAKARLYPFQFKPLVKFLDNPGHTLLIADEVGLGKTIETGYILREWKHRQAVDEFDPRQVDDFDAAGLTDEERLAAGQATASSLPDDDDALVPAEDAW